MKIEVSDETIKVIQTLTGMTVEEFLEQSKENLLKDQGNNISIKDAAKIMGKSEQFIRIGLQRNLLPFGVAYKMSSRYSYYISPKLFKEYVG